MKLICRCKESKKNSKAFNNLPVIINTNITSDSNTLTTFCPDKLLKVILTFLLLLMVLERPTIFFKYWYVNYCSL